MNEWKPISTAPRECVVVDLWHVEFGRITDQWWDAEDGSWSGMGDDEVFTHWMPIPEPPSA